jgi:uncharacterized membrane protein YfcA
MPMMRIADAMAEPYPAGPGMPAKCERTGNIAAHWPNGTRFLRGRRFVIDGLRGPPLPELLTEPRFLLLACVIAVAGIVRGMSGFGSGMIIAPLAGAFYGPKAALVVVAILDALPMIPLTLPALKHTVWREVVPVAVGSFLFLPLGLFILRHGDPTVLRWIISAAILACVVVLWSGYRYGGPRGPGVSVAAGAVAGTLSGVAQIPGPPVIAYWMASGLPALIVRANLLSFFLISEFVTLGNLWFADMLKPEPVTIGILAMPIYFLALLAGWRLFGLASERTYRRLTFCLIIAAALLALPLWDPLIARLAAALA